MKKDFGFVPFEQVTQTKTDDGKTSKKNDFGFVSFADKPKDDTSNQRYSTDEEDEKEYERNQARSLSRMLETSLGFAGDLMSFFPGTEGKLPTTSDLREFSKEASGGYLEPQGEFEEKSDELLSDITSMAMPGASKYNFVRNIGIPVVANLAKEGIEYLSNNDKLSSWGKTGTMVILDLLNGRKGGVKAYASSLFNKANDLLPKGLSFDASNLLHGLDKVEKTLTQGGSSSSTSRALKKLNEIKGDVRNGKIDAKNLAKYRITINEAIEEIGGYKSEVESKFVPKAKHHLNEVKNEVIKSLEEYGKKYNPEFNKAYKEANEAWAAYSESNKIANFIHKRIPYSPKSKAVQALFHYSPIGAVGTAAFLNPATAIGAGIGIAGYNAYKILDQVIRSPVLGKYYLNIIKEAGQNNVSQTVKNMKALDQNLLNIEKETNQDQE